MPPPTPLKGWGRQARCPIVVFTQKYVFNMIGLRQGYAEQASAGAAGSGASERSAAGAPATSAATAPCAGLMGKQPPRARGLKHGG